MNRFKSSTTPFKNNKHLGYFFDEIIEVVEEILRFIDI